MLGKIADTMFTIKAGTCLWPSNMFESLTIVFVKPLLSKVSRRWVKYHQWLNGKATCVKCSLRIKSLFGVVIRAKFGLPWFSNWTCYGAWHGGCYQVCLRAPSLTMDNLFGFQCAYHQDCRGSHPTGNHCFMDAFLSGQLLEECSGILPLYGYQYMVDSLGTFY